LIRLRWTEDGKKAGSSVASWIRGKDDRASSAFDQGAELESRERLHIHVSASTVDSLCSQSMNSLRKLGLVFAVAGCLLAGTAWADPPAGQGKAPPTKAQRQAARQARQAAKQQAKTGQMHGRTGPNARAGTPRPAPTPTNPPGAIARQGSQTGPNARAGTPRQAPPQQVAPQQAAPPSLPQQGGQSGTNARAGSAGQTPASNFAQRQPPSQNALPAGWQQKLQEMPPDEREKFLNNNERFKNLPKAQQDQIKKNLADYDKLPPQQRASMNRNAEALSKLTPEQRDNLRKNVLPQWRNLPADRRQEINQRLKSLNGLSDAERNQKLNDPNLYQGLSPQEHDVMKQLGDYKLTPGGGGGGL